MKLCYANYSVMVPVWMLVFIFERGYAGIPKGSVCPEEISVGWLSISPYLTVHGEEVTNDMDVSNKNGFTSYNISGAIIEITSRGFDECCRNNVTLQYTTRFDDITALIDASVNSSLDVVLPIRTNVGKKTFLTFPFVGLIESPGAVLYDLNRHQSRKAILDMLLTVLPAVCLLLIWVCVIGVLFWILDVIPRNSHKRRTIQSLLNEIWDSIWWAFVTLATVGYGDVIPSRLPGRVLCYIWLILSNITLACFSATVTSILIAECFNSELTIEGSKIGVINGSREHSLVLKNSGFPKAYHNVDKLLASINTDNDIDGILMDIYTASSYSDSLNAFRIQKVFEDVSAYGVVLRTRTVHIRSCLRQFIINNQREIYAKLSEMFPPLKTHITSSTSQVTSENLLSADNKETKKSLIALASLLLLLGLIGIASERRRISLKKCESKNDDMENFVLLQTIKGSYEDNLKTLTKELHEEVEKLKYEIEKTICNTDAIYPTAPTTMFRAIQSQK